MIRCLHGRQVDCLITRILRLQFSSRNKNLYKVCYNRMEMNSDRHSEWMLLLKVSLLHFSLKDLLSRISFVPCRCSASDCLQIHDRWG